MGGGRRGDPAVLARAGIGRIDGKITAYVCIGQRCSLPLTEPELLKEKLKEERHVAVQVAASSI